MEEELDMYVSCCCRNRNVITRRDYSVSCCPPTKSLLDSGFLNVKTF